MGEGGVDALGVKETAGVAEKWGAEVGGVGDLVGGVAFAVGASRRVDPGGAALASGGGAVLAALGVGKLFGIGAGAGVLVWGLEGGFLHCGRNNKII